MQYINTFLFHVLAGIVYSITSIYQNMYVINIYYFITSIIFNIIIKIIIYKYNIYNYIKYMFFFIYIFHIMILIILSISIINNYGHIINIISPCSISIYNMFIINNKYDFNGKYVFTFVYNVNIILIYMKLYTNIELYICCLISIIILYVIIFVYDINIKDNFNVYTIIYTTKEITTIVATKIVNRKFKIQKKINNNLCDINIRKIDIIIIINDMINIIISYMFGTLINIPSNIYYIYYISCTIFMILNIYIRYLTSINKYLLLYRFCMLISLFFIKKNHILYVFIIYISIFHNIIDSISKTQWNNNFKLYIIKSIITDILTALIGSIFFYIYYIQVTTKRIINFVGY